MGAWPSNIVPVSLCLLVLSQDSASFFCRKEMRISRKHEGVLEQWNCGWLQGKHADKAAVGLSELLLPFEEHLQGATLGL